MTERVDTGAADAATGSPCTVLREVPAVQPGHLRVHTCLVPFLNEPFAGGERKGPSPDWVASSLFPW